MTDDFEFEQTLETKPKRGVSPSAAVASAKPKAKSHALLDPIPMDAEQDFGTLGAEPTTSSGDPEQRRSPEQNPDQEQDEPQYDQNELNQIFDEIIFSGEYAEDITIRGRLKVRLRTRTAEEIEAISRVVDSTTANLVATLAEKRSLLNLQYALASFQGKDLRALKIEERAKFLGRIPGPVIGSLLSALSKFDQKVYAACKEGEENF